MANVTVPFTIVADSGIQEAYDSQSGASATVKFKCLWDDHYTLVQELTGTAVYNLAAGGSAPSIQAYYPATYPGSPNLYCRAIDSVVPFGRPKILSWLPAGTWLAKEYAIVTAKFSYFPIGSQENNNSQGQQDASGKPFTSTSIQLSADVMTIPDYSLQFPDKTWNNAPFPIIVPQAQITMKRFMMPYLPVMEMLSILGGVNQAPMSLGDYTCPVGTVMFCGGNTEVSCNTDGTIIQTVDYTFMYRYWPWNQAVNPKSGNWENVTNNNGQQPYPQVDFSILP